MSGYSLDLRERVIRAWESGKTQQWIAETFDVSISTVKRYISRYRQTGQVEPTVQKRAQPLIGAGDRAKLEQLVAQAPLATLVEYCEAWEQHSGVRVSPVTMCRVLQRFELVRKKDQRRV